MVALFGSDHRRWLIQKAATLGAMQFPLGKFSMKNDQTYVRYTSLDAYSLAKTCQWSTYATPRRQPSWSGTNLAYSTRIVLNSLIERPYQRSSVVEVTDGIKQRGANWEAAKGLRILLLFSYTSRLALQDSRLTGGKILSRGAPKAPT